jgi:hypothetical protein
MANLMEASTYPDTAKESKSLRGGISVRNQKFAIVSELQIRATSSCFQWPAFLLRPPHSATNFGDRTLVLTTFHHRDIKLSCMHTHLHFEDIGGCRE